MGKKILLIDDEVDFTEVVGTLLRFHDFDVDTINEPLLAPEAINKNNYDLIVSDLMMPDINGFELVEKIRTMPRYKDTPIITLSAKLLNDEERKQLLHHGVHCLSKPFEPSGLVDQICQLLG